ncbi:peptide methionine sulfoxide reductase [Psychroserpens burtonensis]|uniref:peptide-methionine (S)-S-oxide reductase n=1 Tax=Psychroserpens burtonensis TaxID=49278 RepID=A0A5C7BBJ6_9FLAO|nr:peptide-methionine (S)-S-oxide reductase [Psychroserpens burtonensis]TXE19343.1 peptide methionine sulfoxide reductase [Psychroserpens burtonensis]
METEIIGFGGGCHWCTEAVFQSLKGVVSVAQGYIASNHENSSFSEGVYIDYNPKTVNLQLLINVHLLTHKSTKNHSMRYKYRSAIYTFSQIQRTKVETILVELNKNKGDDYITEVLDIETFKASNEEITNYYYSNPEKPFCKTFINPKLTLLLKYYSDAVDLDKLSHLKLALAL